MKSSRGRPPLWAWRCSLPHFYSEYWIHSHKLTRVIYANSSEEISLCLPRHTYLDYKNSKFEICSLRILSPRCATLGTQRTLGTAKNAKKVPLRSLRIFCGLCPPVPSGTFGRASNCGDARVPQAMAIFHFLIFGG